MDKAPDAFRTISEVADDLDIPQHVLRFWETRFPQIKPMKRGGGRRYYRPDDVSLLRGIRHLLYGEGYTIRGVQRILREQGVKAVQAVWQQPEESDEPEDDLPLRALESDDAGGDDANFLPTADPNDEAAERGRGLLRILPSLFGADTDEPAERPRARRAPASEDFDNPDELDDADSLLPPMPDMASLRGSSESRMAPPAPTGLRREDLHKLQAALQELGECRRLLDTALAANP